MRKRELIFHAAWSRHRRTFALVGLCALMSMPVSIVDVFINRGNVVAAQSQGQSLNGTISDESGETLIGVSVRVKGTQVGTVTDLDGRFALILPADAKELEVSYVGYASQTVKLSGSRILTIRMAQDVKVLDEFVAIGYGSVKKRDLTGSVSSVKSDVLKVSTSSDALTSLGGRVAGLDISESNDPSQTEIRIRGNRSINGKNEPLFIIDGVQGGSYNDISPSDIESLEVLKDASSTAIYGSQGANGVIIITTKKAKAGKPVVSYDGFAGIQMLSDHPTYRQGDSYINARRNAGTPSGIWNSPADDSKLFTADEWAAYQAGDWTNYDDLTKQNGIYHSHNITASGGNEFTTARFSLGYYGADGRLKKAQRERYTLRANIDHKINKYIKAGIVSQLTHNSKNSSPFEGTTSGLQLGSPFDENGKAITYPLGTQGYINPMLNVATDNAVVGETKGTNIMANGYLEITPIEGLSYRSTFGATLGTIRTGSYNDAQSTTNYINQTSSSSMNTTNSYFMNWDNVISYNKTIGIHSFGVMALTSWTKSIQERINGSGTDQIVSNQRWWSLQSNNTTSVSTDYVQYQTFSYAGRFNYNLMDRYLLTGSIRWDGASRLSKQWEYFPSIALGWIITEESFMRSTRTWLDNLKIRASYGMTGNSGIEPYGTQSGMQSLNSNGMAFQDNPVIWYVFKQSIGNKELGWEKTGQIDLGIDFSIFKGRFSGTIDYYDSQTSDLLLYRTLPSMMGQGLPINNDRTKLGVFSMFQNIGDTRNRGVEIQLNSINIQKKDFSWTTTLTFSANKEEIVSLTDGRDYFPSTEQEKNSLLIGYPIKSYHGYNRLGIWQLSEAEEAAKYFKDANKTSPYQPGDIKVEDLNGDNIIDTSNDYKYVGSRTPDWFAGLNNSFTYKNFDFSIYMNMRWGQYGNNPLGSFNPATGGAYETYNYWTPENGGNDFPALNRNAVFNQYHGYLSYDYIDNSFFRIKNISLGYTLHKSDSRKIGLNNLRFYVTGQNLLSVAKHKFYNGFDPEGLNRSFVFGINFDF